MPLKVGHHQAAIEMVYRWRANNGPPLNACLVAL